MDDEARWLFDDDEILVFVDHLKGNVLSLRQGRRRRGQVNSVGLAWFDPEIAVSYRFACMRDGAALKQLLESRTADIA